MTKRLFSKARKKKTEPSNGLATHRLMAQRREEIRNVLDQAMRNLPNADWSKNSPEIVAAQEKLDNAVTDFVHGDITLMDVKDAYKSWAKLHQTQSGEQP